MNHLQILLEVEVALRRNGDDTEMLMDRLTGLPPDQIHEAMMELSKVGTGEWAMGKLPQVSNSEWLEILTDLTVKLQAMGEEEKLSVWLQGMPPGMLPAVMKALGRTPPE